MVIQITDSDLESRVEALAKAQDVPVSKHAMAKAILLAATKDLKATRKCIEYAEQFGQKQVEKISQKQTSSQVGAD